MNISYFLFILIIVQQGSSLKLASKSTDTSVSKLVGKGLQAQLKEYATKNPTSISLSQYFCQVFTLQEKPRSYKYEISNCLDSLLHERFDHLKQVDHDLLQIYTTNGQDLKKVEAELRNKVHSLIQDSFNNNQFDSHAGNRDKIEELLGGYYLLKFDKCLREKTCLVEFEKGKLPTVALWNEFGFQLNEFEYDEKWTNKVIMFVNFIQNTCVLNDTLNVDSILEATEKFKNAIGQIACDLAARIVESAKLGNQKDRETNFDNVSFQARLFLKNLETEKLQKKYKFVFCNCLETHSIASGLSGALAKDLRGTWSVGLGEEYENSLLKTMDCFEWEQLGRNQRIRV